MVVSLILPDEEMPTTVDGRKADVVSNSLGVVGRLNPSQLYEHELNFITEELHLRAKSLKSFTKDILKFYSIVTPNYHKFLVEELDKDSLNELFEDMYETGLVPVEQPPFFGNAQLETMQKLYTEFKIDKVKFENIQTPLVFGRMYFTK